MRGAPPVTKFGVPRLPGTQVERLELVHRLEAEPAPVTLVTGFAGAGKTVLLSTWCTAHRNNDSAWLTCDAWDIDLTRFWTSVVTALQLRAPEVGTTALEWIEADPEAIVDAVALLVNDLDAFGRPIALVVDDLHVVPPAVTAGLSEFLDRLPANVRVVIGTRSDPLLPLHRWRVTQRLAEIRDADLRFGPDEVDALLRAFAVELSPADVLEVARRTEGWAAGVQLAALSMRGRDDARQFVVAFAGDQRNVADFLVGEVLERQRGDVVEFLTATSIVEDIDADLAAHLTGRDDAALVLRAAEAASLFVVALDDERRSYRYHQLFRDLLRSQLGATDPDRARELHLRAAEWFADRGELVRSVQHLIQGRDIDEAFRVLQDRLLEGWFAPVGDELGQLLDELPPELVAEQRERIVDFAVAQCLAGRVQAGGSFLRRAREIATGEPGDENVEARLETGFAIWFALRGEAEFAIASAQRALELVPRGENATVDSVPLVIVRALLWIDELEAAREVYRDALSRWSNPVSEIALRGAAAGVEYSAGCLRAAGELADSAISDTERTGVADHPGFADARLVRALLAFEHNELDRAERLYEEVLRIVEVARPPHALSALLGLARVWHARGDWSAATAFLDRARGTLPHDARSPLLHQITEIDTTFALQEGDLGRAEQLLDQLPDTTRTQLLGAQYAVSDGRPDAAEKLLDLLRRSNLTVRLRLDVALLNVSVVSATGGDPRAHLEEAVALGRTEGFVRTMVATDPLVTKLLTDLLVRSARDGYSDVLLAAIDSAGGRVASNPSGVVGDGLSERERAVLRYLPTRMSTREIANELFVSMNTLKTHLKSIYRKLDAGSRAEAVTRARADGLLR